VNPKLLRRIRHILLLVVFTGMALHLSAQSANVTKCDGSLGDPVINQDFGSGPNPGAPLPASVTNMQYTTSACPNDGQYTISNSLTASCFGDTWHNVPHDHTGNPNGYMMIINASFQPSVFFTQSAPTLCPGTTYLFSAYILNLMNRFGSNVIEPNITFEVVAPDGSILAIDSSGTIPGTVNPTWVKDSLYFTTPNTVSSVVVKLINNAPGGYGNDLILDDITFRACGPVIQSGFGSTTGAKTETLCAGDNADYTFKASVATGGTGGSSNTGYQWQNYTTTNGWQDIPGQTTDTYTVQTPNIAAGTYQYRVGIANGLSTAASCRVYSSPLTINAYANPVITGVAATQTVCAGDSVVLSASGGTSYKWSGPGLATSQNPVTIKNATAANTGQYTVTAYNQYDCSSTASTTITVNPLPVASVAGGTTICSGDKTQISASGGTTYSWSPGKTLSDSTIANPIASPLDTTTYKVTIANSSGCSVTDSVTVNVERKAIANAGTNKVIFEGQSTRLNGSEKYGSSYYWTPDSALSDPNSLTPLANPTNNITYTLHVRSANNCGDDTSSVFVRVYKKITIPNTFSPNGDGINDTWNIDALVTYPDCLLQVFDRYGQQVYKSIGYNKPWDGKYNGNVLPTGTYYYVLDLKNSTPKMSGWLLIMR
jgi:gliding motility-associated-like protein